MTVGMIIDAIIKKTQVEQLPDDKTCDHLMAGSLDMEVTKIVTTFMATVEVLEQTIAAGANFIITHEPTWFTGADDTKWLLDDPIYQKKKALIEENHIAIWRFHDYMHMGREDGIYRGFDIELGWSDYRMKTADSDGLFGPCYHIPKTTLGALCQFIKKTLSMDVVQIVGNPDMSVERVGVLVGGGSLGLGVEEMPMQLMHQNELDLLICGDIIEWTISAYVRDAVSLGLNKGMLVLGHERSEEMGMKHLGAWLNDIVEQTEVLFIDAKEPFVYL